MNRYNCIVLCGPTATGKTRLGVSLSLAIGGEIISIDSRQVYRGMDIGTGKDLEEYETEGGSVPYHLIDIVEPDEVYSLYQFQRDFHRAFQNILNRNRIPVCVGGTGLYLESILRDFDVPAVPAHAEFRRRLMALDRDELVRELTHRNPDLLRTCDLTSKKRIVRALEIAEFGSVDMKEPREPKSTISPIVFCITPPPQVIHERIAIRLRDRLTSGLIEEVRRVMESGISEERFDMFGMEYGHVAAFLRGSVAEDEMREQLERAIRKMAKRQMTWFRGMERRGIAINWLSEPSLDEVLSILAEWI